MGEAPQSLLLSVLCPACGRPSRELSPCPWCGERSPLAPRTRGDLARLAAGFVILLSSAISEKGALWSSGGPLSEGAFGEAGWGSLAVGLLSGFFLALAKPSSEAVPGEAGRRSLAAALLTSLLAVALRAFAAPYPLPFAVRHAWILPALAAAAFALRVSAEAPNAPASGDLARIRAIRRHAPDLAAALSLAPFAAVFAACGPSLLSLAGLALVLGVWLSRLSRPVLPTMLVAAGFSLLLPDPAFLAFGFLAAAAFRPPARETR